ncbi:unnamed protein product [Hyaloperonospora brassicae]|uniref:Ubiquitin-like domain-containing protein n=1 Tax=Hyaloperonospora brassicae TaxID=162125 RepID=A0AAV0UHL8_HYABA|nr:unnamed protein product [Hyaloperonospora brassicae]
MTRRPAEVSAVCTYALEAVVTLKHKCSGEPQREPQREEAEADGKRDVECCRLLEDGETRTGAVEEQQQQQQQMDIAGAVDVQEPVRKRVRFNVAEVVEFEPTMWTAAVSSEGVPLGMSVDVRRRTKRLVDTYESERVEQRVGRQEYMELGYLEPGERLDILENAGHSISVLSRVEHDTFRINRERWESNEYDLMYQYGLGDVPLLMMEEDEPSMLQPEDGDDIMLVDDSSDDDFFFGSSSARNMAVDSEVRFAMENMDAYDAVNMRAYDDFSIDYASDCILGDDDSSDENNELPYAIDSFESPHDCDLLEMGTSPSDVSNSSDCMLAGVKPPSCAQLFASSTPSAGRLTESSSSVIAAEAAPVVAV